MSGLFVLLVLVAPLGLLLAITALLEGTALVESIGNFLFKE